MTGKYPAPFTFFFAPDLRGPDEGRDSLGDALAFVELFGAEGRVWCEAMPLGELVQAAVPDGVYVARAMLPSGELLDATVVIGENNPEPVSCTFEKPRFWFSAAAVRIGVLSPKRAPRQIETPHRSTGDPGVSLRPPSEGIVLQMTRTGAVVGLQHGFAGFLPHEASEGRAPLAVGSRVDVKVVDLDAASARALRRAGPTGAPPGPPEAVHFTLLDDRFREVEQTRLLRFGPGNFLEEPTLELVGHDVVWQCRLAFESQSQRMSMGRCWLRIERENGAAQYLAVPFAAGIDITATTRPQADPRVPADVTVTTDSVAADSLLGFLMCGRMEAVSAWEIVRLSEFVNLDTDALKTGVIDIPSIVVQFYAWLQMGSTGLIDKARELRWGFPMISDFSVMVGWLELRRDDFAAAAQAFVTAAEVGFPCYTLGNRLLSDGLDALCSLDGFGNLDFVRNIVRRRGALLDAASSYTLGTTEIPDMEFALVLARV